MLKSIIITSYVVIGGSYEKLRLPSCLLFILKYNFLPQDKIMHFPTWVDLKGKDAVPETVHHVVNN